MGGPQGEYGHRENDRRLKRGVELLPDEQKARRSTRWGHAS